jgi:RNA polymerase sporulation-specific sigma factor
VEEIKADEKEVKPEKEKAPELDLSKYAPLVKSIVKRYVGKGVEYDDLFQLGCMGLVKAHNKFDSRYGVKFTTYAVPLIAGEIKRYLRDDGQIKVSRSVKGLFIKIKKYLALHQNDSTTPSVEDLAREFDCTPEDIVFAMEASHMPISLYAGEEGEGVTLAEKLVGDDNLGLVDKVAIHAMLDQLEIREKKVILLRYFRNATQSEVARRLNISQVQVSRIEQRVLEAFRRTFKDEAETI